MIRMSMPAGYSLFAHKLDRPALFPGHLPIPGYLSLPGPIDRLFDHRNLAFTRNTIPGWALFLKKANGICSPWRGQHILFFKVCVEDCSSHGRFIGDSSVRCTTCKRKGKKNKPNKLLPQRWGSRVRVLGGLIDRGPPAL